MPNFTFPRTFHDGTGEVASGVQVMENFTVLKEHIETLETGQTGAWTIYESLSAKLEESAAFATVRVRKELGATVARLRGVLVVKAGETLSPGELALTLPAGFRPTGKAVGLVASAGGGASTRVEIGTDGKLTCISTLTA